MGGTGGWPRRGWGQVRTRTRPERWPTLKQEEDPEARLAQSSSWPSLSTLESAFPAALENLFRLSPEDPLRVLRLIVLASSSAPSSAAQMVTRPQGAAAGDRERRRVTPVPLPTWNQLCLVA